MDWLIYLLLLYLGSNGTALYECKSCECCKTDQCQYYNGYQNNCIDGCIDGYYGIRCTQACMTNCLECENASSCTKCKNGFYLYRRSCSPCPQNCLTCSSKSNCNTCRDGFYNIYWYNLYLHFDCRRSCKDTCKSCSSYNKCNDCKDGKYNGDHNDCRESCNLACKACTSYNNCTKCETGKYGELCQNTCGFGCENHECDLITGNCKCVSSFQGDKSDQYCDRSCLKCNRINGECSACRNGKYSKDCSKDCSTNCNATKELLMCAVNDGACLSGCNTPTKYGSHCEMNCSSSCMNNTCNWKTGFCLNGCVDNFFGEPCNKECSVNCIRDTIGGGSCNDVNGDCTHGCKAGFHGDKCEKKCNEHCVHNTCDKASGKCIHGCKNGFSGSSCTEENTDDDESMFSNIGASIGVGIGAVTAMFLVVGLIIVLKRYTRCRNQEEDKREPPNEMTSISGRNDMSSAGVNTMEDQESDAVYENVSEYEQLQENTKDTSTYSHLVTATSSS